MTAILALQTDDPITPEQEKYSFLSVYSCNHSYQSQFTCRS